MPRKRTRSVEGECVIPPVIPDTALPDLILARDPDSEVSLVFQNPELREEARLRFTFDLRTAS